MKILGIDLGGMSAKIGLVENKKITKRWVVKTDIKNIWKNIFDNLDGLNLNEVDAIGISMPGFINHKTSFVKLAGNLNLKNYDAKAEIKKIINNDIYILNDANAAALGEFSVLNQDDISMLMYTIGTGIGGGLIINGNLVYGKDGYAGEFGHGGKMQNTYPCSCGLKHCIEAISSATGIEKELSAFFKKPTTIKEVADKFKQGDKDIKEIFAKCLRPLASHMAIMETAINPEMIVIGGGPSALGESLINLIKELIKEENLDFIADSTQVQIATLGNDAGIIGAAHWAKVNHNK